MSHRTALAILAALVLLLAGCTVAWRGSTSLDVTIDPFSLQTTALEQPPPGPSIVLPTNPYPRDPAGRTE